MTTVLARTETPNTTRKNPVMRFHSSFDMAGMVQLLAMRSQEKSTHTDHLDAETRKRVSKAGGHARAKKLSKKARTEIARRAALARWSTA
jgi:hypothetical protein